MSTKAKPTASEGYGYRPAVTSFGTAVALCVTFLFLSACSRQSGKSESQPTGKKDSWHDGVAPLARHYNCVVLEDEIRSLAGTNRTFSLDVQHALKPHKRLVARGFLLDMVQLEGSVEAGFELFYPAEAPFNAAYLLKLECPTNAVGLLLKERPDSDELLDIFFEVAAQSGGLRTRPRSSEDADDGTLRSVIVIEGQLIDVQGWAHDTEVNLKTP